MIIGWMEDRVKSLFIVVLIFLGIFFSSFLSKDYILSKVLNFATSSPIIEILSPKDGSETTENEILIQGKIYDEESEIDTVKINGVDLLFIAIDGSFEYFFTLSEGKNNIEIVAINKVGLMTDNKILIYKKILDITPPKVRIDYPVSGQTLNDSNLTIKGNVSDDESGVEEVFINEKKAFLDQNGEFYLTIILEKGKNIINIKANDNAKNTTVIILEINFEVQKENQAIIIELWIGKKIAKVDGNTIILDIEPLIYNGRTIVPIRFIAEAFNAIVLYNPQDQKISISVGTTNVSLWIDKTEAYIETKKNGEIKSRIISLEIPPMLKNSRTLVPLRFISEAFGAILDWNSLEQKITISYEYQED